MLEMMIVFMLTGACALALAVIGFSLRRGLAEGRRIASDLDRVLQPCRSTSVVRLPAGYCGFVPLRRLIRA